MGLCDSCHHCQGGAHMLCNQWPKKPLNSQLPTQLLPHWGTHTPGAPATGRRQEGPVLLQSQGSKV